LLTNTLLQQYKQPELSEHKEASHRCGLLTFDALQTFMQHKYSDGIARLTEAVKDSNFHLHGTQYFKSSFIFQILPVNIYVVTSLWHSWIILQ
jgi:hypothetical protein